MSASARLSIGLVYETHDSYARTEGDPHDFNVEYEPESTVEALEGAIRELGHDPVRLGHPHALLREIASGELARRQLDAALCIAEGYGSRNRESWGPVLLEMAEVPMMGSDALTLSLTLDKAWANERAHAAGVPVAPQCVAASPAEAARLTLPADFPLFVKPRWEGTSKGIRRSSRVSDRADLAREVGRIVADYRQPALIEKFLAGPEYTVVVVGDQPARALPVLQRALEAESQIGLHALEGEAPAAGWRHETPGSLDPALESELQRLALRAFEAFDCLDFARVDFRLAEAWGSSEPRVIFLEINPLPTFATDGSFAILAELAGRTLESLLADVFRDALVRLAGTPQRGRGMHGPRDLSQRLALQRDPGKGSMTGKR